MSRHNRNSDLTEYLMQGTMPELVEKLGLKLDGSNKMLALDRQEKKASIQINLHYLYDFGTGKWIGKLGLIQFIRECNPQQALKIFAELFGLPEFHTTPEDQQKIEQIEAISKTYTNIFKYSLKESKKATDYLTSRGIPLSLIDGQVGYMPWNSDPVNWETAKKHGLINHNGDFFLFKNRIIIPVVRGGQIVSLIGRTPDPEVEPPYLYPCNTDPEMPAALFGLDECRNEKTVYLCEGVTDKWTLEAHGYPAIAIFGTQGLNKPRMRELRRTKIEKLILALDSDRNSAGQKAALEKGATLFAAGFEVEIVTLPLLEGEDKVDINSYFQKMPAMKASFEAISRVHILNALLQDLSENETPSTRYQMFTERIMKLISKRKKTTWSNCAQLLYDKAQNFSLGFKIPSIAKIEKMIKEQAKAREEEEKPKYKPLEYVARIAERGHYIYSGQRFYEWDTKIYQHLYDEEIDRLIVKELAKDYESEVHLAQVGEIRRLLGIDRFVRPEKLNQAGIIVLKNGILDLETEDFSDKHSPDVYSTILANVKFEASAKCPNWLNLISSSLPVCDKQLLLQEWFGYTFFTRPVFEKALILVGDGSNGKSKILSVWEHMVGCANCSALGLEDLKERFRLVELEGKLLNICYEGDTKKLLSDARFKSLVSGEPQTVERKGKDAYKFSPFVKMVIACNTLPRTKDKSYGYERRLCILPFDVQFKDAEDLDPNNPREKKKILGITDKIIKDELDGVFIWALEGYARLKKHGRFTVPESSRNVIEDYVREVNPIIAFVDDRLELAGPYDKISLKDIYADYQEWCKENGHKHLVTSKTLSKTLESARVEGQLLQKERTRLGMAYVGVKLVA